MFRHMPGYTTDRSAPCAARGSRPEAAPRSRCGTRRPAAAARRGSATSATASSPTCSSSPGRPGQPRKPGPLEPVLLLRRAAVVRGAAVGQDGRQSGAARVPRAGPRARTVPCQLPRDAVRARRVGRRHPVLLVGYVERMAADPRLPAAVGRRWTIGSLTPVRSSPGKTVRASAVARSAGSSASSSVDPPMLARAAWRGADIEAPTSVVGPDDGRPLHRGRIEARLLQLGDRRRRARRPASARRRSSRGRRDRCARGRRSRSCRRRRAPRWRHRPTSRRRAGAGTATTASADPGSGNSPTRGLYRERGACRLPSSPLPRRERLAVGGVLAAGREEAHAVALVLEGR